MKQKITLLMLALMAILTSCNKESEFEAQGNGSGKVAAEFSTQITKAVGNKWSANDQIGVFMVTEGLSLSDENIVDGAANVAYKTATAGESGVFSIVDAAKTIYFPASGNVDFVSYYPYTQTITNYVYPVNVSNQSNQEAIDLLYSDNAKGKNSSTAAVAFKFKHKLTKLAIKVSGSGYTEAELAAIVVKVKGLNTMADFLLKADTILTQSNKADITAKTITAGKSYEAIVIPVETVLGAKIEFAIAGKILSWDINTAAFVEGNRYNYNLVVGRDGVTVGDATIEDWEDNPAPDPGPTPDPNIKKLASVVVDNMLIEYSYDSANPITKRVELITMKQVSPSTGIIVPGGFSKQVSITYADSTATMQGAIPNPAAISYDGKTLGTLFFKTQYKLNKEGFVSSATVMITDSLQRVLDKYSLKYQYTEEGKLASLVQNDSLGNKQVEITSAWTFGNLTSCVMGYYLQMDSSQGGPSQKWETTTETYTYTGHTFGTSNSLLPLAMPTPYSYIDEISVLAASSGLLGRGPRDYMVSSVESDGYTTSIDYTFPDVEALYPLPTSAVVNYDPSDSQNLKFTFK